MSADSNSPPSETNPGSRPELLRVLGLGIAIAMVVGNTIGSGIFLKPGKIAGDIGSFPFILAGWIGCGVVCMLGALCFAELGAMLPRAGGMYVYLKEAYGRPVAFLFGWCEFFFGTPASCGALSVAIVGRLVALIRGPEHEAEGWLVVSGALLLLVFAAFVNVRGAIWSGRLQAATTIIKVGSVVLIASAPFLLFAVGKSEVSFSHYDTHIEPSIKTYAAQMASLILAVMWTYNGWEGVTPVAAEVRDPHRNIPRALLGGVGILIAVYVAANIAYHGVLSMSELQQAGMNTAPIMFRKQFSVFGDGAGDFAAQIVLLMIAFSAFGAINSNLLHSPRVAYAMGQDGVFFRRLGNVHARFCTPTIAICTQATMASLMVVGFEFAQRNIPRLKDARLFDLLTDYVIFSASVFQVLTVIGLMLLRRKHPEWERPYRVTGYPWTPLLFIAFYLWFLPTAYSLESFSAHVALALMALGVPAYLGYAVWQRVSSARAENHRS